MRSVHVDVEGSTSTTIRCIVVCVIRTLFRLDTRTHGCWNEGRHSEKHNGTSRTRRDGVLNVIIVPVDGERKAVQVLDHSVVISPVSLRCPSCGEERMTERIGKEGYCGVCGKSWKLSPR